MPALATACIERGKELKRLKATGVKKIASPGSGVATEPMKTHVVAGQTLAIELIREREDYETGLPPTTYGDLSLRCGFEGQHNARWFGQVTDLIDAACALAGVPSFALVRVREASGEVNHAASAQRKQPSARPYHLDGDGRSVDRRRLPAALSGDDAGGLIRVGLWANKKCVELRVSAG